MKVLPLYLMLFLHSGIILAQKHDYTWMIGHGGLSSINAVYSTTFIHFGQPIEMYDAKIHMAFIGHSAISVMSDEAGDLLFYTNGCYIANAQGDTIEGGGLLNYAAEEGYWDNCEYNEGYGIPQGVVSVPLDAANGKYAIIHKDKRNTYTLPNPVFAWNLYVTYVDMHANNGKGRVTKSKVVLTDTLSFSDVTACRHANGKDWWFMVMKDQTNRFHRFLLRKDTVLNAKIQFIGDTLWGDYDICQAAFSPDGTKYLRVNPCNGLMLYDFDRNTGELSNFRKFWISCTNVQSTDSVRFFGAGFSPNSKYIYMSGLNKMYQLESDAADFGASAKLIGVYDGYVDSIGVNLIHLVPQRFYLMSNGPDCKLYITAPSQGRVFHVIHHPDRPAPDCAFEQHALRLPTYRSFSIPNFAHYRLGTDNPVCDSTLSFVSALWNIGAEKEVIASLSPNPSYGFVQLDIDLRNRPEAYFRLYNLSGHEVFGEPLRPYRWSYTFELGHLSAGFYIYHIQTPAGQSLDSGKLMLLR